MEGEGGCENGLRVKEEEETEEEEGEEIKEESGRMIRWLMRMRME